MWIKALHRKIVNTMMEELHWILPQSDRIAWLEQNFTNYFDYSNNQSALCESKHCTEESLTLWLTDGRTALNPATIWSYRLTGTNVAPRSRSLLFRMLSHDLSTLESPSMSKLIWNELVLQRSHFMHEIVDYTLLFKRTTITQNAPNTKNNIRIITIIGRRYSIEINDNLHGQKVL